MARRHNEYSRLLGTVENDIQPLTEQAGMDIPMTDVPSLRDVAASCASMADRLNRHAHHLGAMADMQPSFSDWAGEPPDLQDTQFEGASDSMPGDYY